MEKLLTRSKSWTGGTKPRLPLMVRVLKKMKSGALATHRIDTLSIELLSETENGGREVHN